jgi:hypothetical protein
MTMSQHQQDRRLDGDTSNEPACAALLTDQDLPPPYGSIAPVLNTTCSGANNRLPLRRELRRAQWQQRSPTEQTCVNILINVGAVICAGIALFTLLAFFI